MERLLKLQKRAARIILQIVYSTPSSEMFAELGLQPINKRLAYNKAVFTYKALNGQTPQYISELLNPVAETRDRHLRSSSNGTLAVPRSRTSVFDHSVSVSAPRLWNSLPIDIRNSTTLYGFKNSLRNVLNNFIDQFIFVIFQQTILYVKHLLPLYVLVSFYLGVCMRIFTCFS